MYIKSSNIKDVISAFDKLNVQENEAVFVGISSYSSINIEELIAELNKFNVNFFGGLFPGLIDNWKYCENGIILQKLGVWCKPFLISGDISAANLEKFTGSDDFNKSMLIFVDGFADNFSSILEDISNNLEEKITALGASAGNHFINHQNCIFDNSGFYKNCAVAAGISKSAKTGIRHGFKKLTAPLVVTKSNGFVISELNWDEAFSVYKDYLKALGIDLKLSEFFETANSFPFSIFLDENDYLIRDVLRVNEKGELICGGEIPENSVLAIMKGDKVDLIKSAAISAKESLAENLTPAETFISYSYCRMKFLKENFQNELEAIKKQMPADINSYGVISIAEIDIPSGKIGKINNNSTLIGNFYE